MAFAKNLVLWCPFFNLENSAQHSVLYDSVKTVCLGKIWFFSYGLKMLSTSQNAVFFDHWYFSKESIDTVDFSLGDNHQGMVGSQTTTFGWILPVMPLVQSDCRTLWSSIFQEKVKWYLCFSDPQLCQKVQLIQLCPSARQSVYNAFFSGQFHYLFMTFCMKLGFHKHQKVTAQRDEQFLYLMTSIKNILKRLFWIFKENF